MRYVKRMNLLLSYLLVDNEGLKLKYAANGRSVISKI